MTELNHEDILNESFPEPTVFLEQLNIFKSQMPAFLEDFKQDFINFNLNPQNNEYEQAFQNDKNQLISMNKNIINLGMNVEKTTDEINKILLGLNILIEEAKKKNIELKHKLGIIDNESYTSGELIGDYKEIYNYRYLRNCGLVLCIIGAGLTIAKVYSNTH
jgi:hypothetical protein